MKLQKIDRCWSKWPTSCSSMWWRGKKRSDGCNTTVNRLADLQATRATVASLLNFLVAVALDEERPARHIVCGKQKQAKHVVQGMSGLSSARERAWEREVASERLG